MLEKDDFDARILEAKKEIESLGYLSPKTRYNFFVTGPNTFHMDWYLLSEFLSARACLYKPPVYFEKGFFGLLEAIFEICFLNILDGKNANDQIKKLSFYLTGALEEHCFGGHKYLSPNFQENQDLVNYESLRLQAITTFCKRYASKYTAIRENGQAHFTDLNDWFCIDHELEHMHAEATDVLLAMETDSYASSPKDERCQVFWNLYLNVILQDSYKMQKDRILPENSWEYIKDVEFEIDEGFYLD